MAFSGDKAVSSIADTSGESFTSQASGSLATATVAGYAYIYSSTAALSEGTEVITITWASSAQGTASCYDTAGWGATKTAAATAGTGAISKTGVNQTISATVSTYTPTVGTIEISIFGGSVCAAPGTFSVLPPEEKSIVHSFPAGIDTSTNCRTSAPSSDYVFVGGSAVNSTVKGTTAFTDAWTISGAQKAGSPGTNTADWAEVAAYFPANTVQSTSLGETMTATIHAQLQDVVKGESNVLGVIPSLPQVVKSEIVSLVPHYALPQKLNIEQDCMGVQITVNSVPTLNTGVICGAQGIQTVVVYVIAACNFFQLQCWWYPLMFMGMYAGFYIAVGMGFKVSEKAFIYLAFSGILICTLIEIQMGIMTPLVPIVMVVGLVGYSLNLGDRIGGAISGRVGGGTTE